MYIDSLFMVFNVSMLNALAQVSSTFVLSWMHLNFSVKYINYSYKLIEVQLAQKRKGDLVDSNAPT